MCYSNPSLLYYCTLYLPSLPPSNSPPNPPSYPLPSLTPSLPSSPSISQVQYYGLIKQSTGEDWVNAKISLSTAQPSLGGAPPTLGTNTIRFKTPRYYPSKQRKTLSYSSAPARSAMFLNEYDPTIEDAPYDCWALISDSSRKKVVAAKPVEVETSEVGIFTRFFPQRTGSISML